VGDQCQPRENSDDQREAPVVVTLHGVGVSDLEQTSQDPHRPYPFRNRLSSVKG
jgi:predicted esterase